MPKKKTTSPVADDLEISLYHATSRLDYTPEPTYSFSVGEPVQIGNLMDAIVKESLHDGKIYLIEYTNFNNNYGNPILTPGSLKYWLWYEIRPKNNAKDNHIISNDDLRLSYFQTGMVDLIGKAFSFGLDFDPEYQRGYVWELDDNIDLIDSIFQNVDIGKFVFIHYKWQEHPNNYSYAILDGKQRLGAILDYYKNLFPYNGLYFNDLSKHEQDHFKYYHVNVAEIENINREQRIRLFLKLNKTGKVMSKDNLERVERLLKDISYD